MPTMTTTHPSASVSMPSSLDKADTAMPAITRNGTYRSDPVGHTMQHKTSRIYGYLDERNRSFAHGRDYLSKPLIHMLTLNATPEYERLRDIICRRSSRHVRFGLPLAKKDRYLHIVKEGLAASCFPTMEQLLQHAKQCQSFPQYIVDIQELIDTGSYSEACIKPIYSLPIGVKDLIRFYEAQGRNSCSSQ